MDKKLPSVFANKISKSAAHNNTVYYTSGNQDNGVRYKNDSKPNYQNINQKINSLLI